MRMDFPRWEDGDPTGWISLVKRYFHFHKTPEESMVDIVAIHQREMRSNGTTGSSIHMAYLCG
ncbi:hypothetical protein BHM03_00048316, partial [Ensete ventricosum]